MEEKRLFNRQDVKFLIISILLGIVVYLNSLGGGFHYDDFHVIKKVNVVFGIWNLRFLGWLSLYFNSFFGKSNAVWYHITNLFIHLCSGAAVYSIALLVMKKSKKYIPFFVSAIFMLHPLASETVNYISSRFTQLASLFCLLTLLCFILFVNRKKKLYLAMTITFFIAGMYSKGIGIYYVTAGLLVYSFCFLKWKELFTRKRDLMITGVGLLLLFLLMAVFGAERFGSRFFWQHFMVQNRIFLMKYLRLLLVPIGLNVDHFIIPPQNFFLDFKILLSLVVNVALVSYAVLTRKRNRIVSFAILWVYAMVFPYFLLTSRELVVEYRAYPILLGLALLLGYLFDVLISREKTKKIVFSVLLIFFSAITISRNRVWSDDMLLWQDAAGKSPQSARAFCNLGLSLKDKGFNEQAIEAFDRSLELRFQYPYAVYMNRGVVYCEQEQYGRALDDFSRALELNSGSSELYINRGRVYYRQGLSGLAIEDFTKALKLKSNNEKAYLYRGRAYESKGLYDRAIADLSRAIELDPRMINAWFIRGNAYLEKKLYNKAIDDYKVAISLNASFMNAYNNLGSAYAEKGLYEKALEVYNRAIAVSPGYAIAYGNRAVIYNRLGNYELAKVDEMKFKELKNRGLR